MIRSLRWAIAPLLLALATACTVPVDPPNPGNPGDPDSEVPPLTVDPNTLLPSLSPEALQRQSTELQGWIQSELDLVGLGKITQVGKPISPELNEFRQAWATVDPTIAPFLGTWIKDWNLMPHDYMTVLPSTVPGQVCLVRYRQEETEVVPIEIITTPLEFSVAQVVDGQLLGSTTQTAESLIRPTPGSAYVPYDIEFIGTVEANGNLRLYASQQPPTIDPTWDAGILESIQAYGCTEATP